MIAGEDEEGGCRVLKRGKREEKILGGRGFEFLDRGNRGEVMVDLEYLGEGDFGA